MAKQTLLEIVRSVSNSLNLDYVNDIYDTEESEQITQMAQDVFYEFITGKEWPHLRELSRLTQLSDLNQPTTLRLPENCAKMVWLNYNKTRENGGTPNWKEVEYLYPDDFIRVTNTRNLDQDHIQEAYANGDVPILVRNDKQPRYWTSFDDEHVVMDAFDSEVEDTLRGENTQAMMFKIPAWDNDNDFVPDLPWELFPGYLAELKSVCSFEINEVIHQKAEQQAARQRRFMSNAAWRAHEDEPTPDFGRNSAKGGRSFKRSPLFAK